MTTPVPTDPPAPNSIELIARVLWQERGRALLCRNKGRDYWFLPGGHIEPGESARDAAARELVEEAGRDDLTIGPCRLVHEQRFTQPDRKGRPKPRHEYTLLFDATHPNWPAHPDHPNQPAPVESREDHIEFTWAEPAQLPELNLLPAALRAWLTARPGGLDTPDFLSDTPPSTS